MVEFNIIGSSPPLILTAPSPFISGVGTVTAAPVIDEFHPPDETEGANDVSKPDSIAPAGKNLKKPPELKISIRFEYIDPIKIVWKKRPELHVLYDGEYHPYPIDGYKQLLHAKYLGAMRNVESLYMLAEQGDIASTHELAQLARKDWGIVFLLERLRQAGRELAKWEMRWLIFDPKFAPAQLMWDAFNAGKDVSKTYAQLAPLFDRLIGLGKQAGFGRLCECTSIARFHRFVEQSAVAKTYRSHKTQKPQDGLNR